MSIVPNLDEMTDEQKLAVLESVQKSIAESKEIQKRKIGENVELVVQALKKIESDIRDRFDGVSTAIEKRVSSIKDGRDGANGKDGRDGKDGKSGRDGLKGDRGVDGQAGRDGVDGVDGISVVNANIDFDGSLIISLSDGREINVGEVVSADVAEKIKVISTMSTNGAVGIKDEGTSISTGVKTINFVGATVTATNSGDDVTVTVSGGGGSGTVTSVALSGGTTGLTVSGSPITTTGTITLAGTLAVANGGTGATTASGARTNLGLAIGTDVLAPTGSAASLTSFPTFNQNTTGTAAGLSATLVATSGGTGQSSYAVGDLLYASTTTALSKLADVAIGNALISGGVGVAPSWGKVGLTTHISGTLPVANGGTNASSASITAFNNITGYSASGATGTTSTNLVFSTSPTLTTPTATTTIGVGNATPSASGAGITFPATQSASSDANTLDDYEEGTWTATDASGASLSFTSTTQRYTKVGRLVTLQIDNLAWPITANGNAAEIGGLPFAAGTSAGAGGITNYSGSTVQIIILGGASSIRLYNMPSVFTRTSNANMSNNSMYFSITYSV